MFRKLIVAAALLIAAVQAYPPRLNVCDYNINCSRCRSGGGVDDPSRQGCQKRHTGLYYKVSASGHSCGTCWHEEFFYSSTDCRRLVNYETGLANVNNIYGRCGSCIYSDTGLYYKDVCSVATIETTFYSDKACTTEIPPPSTSISPTITLNNCSRTDTDSYRFTLMGCEYWAEDQFSDSSCSTPATAAQQEPPSAFGLCYRFFINSSYLETVGLNCPTEAVFSSDSSPAPSNSVGPPSGSSGFSTVSLHVCPNSTCTGCTVTDVSTTCVSSNGHYYTYNAAGSTCGDCFGVNFWAAGTSCTGAVLYTVYLRCGQCASDSSGLVFERASCSSSGVVISYYSDATCTTIVAPKFAAPAGTCISVNNGQTQAMFAEARKCEWIATRQYTDSSCTRLHTTQSIDSETGGICVKEVGGDYTKLTANPPTGCSDSTGAPVVLLANSFSSSSPKSVTGSSDDGTVALALFLLWVVGAPVVLLAVVAVVGILVYRKVKSSSAGNGNDEDDDPTAMASLGISTIASQQLPLRHAFLTNAVVEIRDPQWILVPYAGSKHSSQTALPVTASSLLCSSSGSLPNPKDLEGALSPMNQYLVLRARSGHAAFGIELSTLSTFRFSFPDESRRFANFLEETEPLWIVVAAAISLWAADEFVPVDLSTQVTFNNVKSSWERARAEVTHRLSAIRNAPQSQRGALVARVKSKVKERDAACRALILAATAHRSQPTPTLPDYHSQIQHVMQGFADAMTHKHTFETILSPNVNDEVHESFAAGIRAHFASVRSSYEAGIQRIRQNAAATQQQSGSATALPHAPPSPGSVGMLPPMTAAARGTDRLEKHCNRVLMDLLGFWTPLVAQQFLPHEKIHGAATALAERLERENLAIAGWDNSRTQAAQHLISVKENEERLLHLDEFQAQLNKYESEILDILAAIPSKQVRLQQLQALAGRQQPAASPLAARPSARNQQSELVERELRELKIRLRHLRHEDYRLLAELAKLMRWKPELLLSHPDLEARSQADIHIDSIDSYHYEPMRAGGRHRLYKAKSDICAPEPGVYDLVIKEYDLTDVPRSARFRREVQILQRVNHPRIVPVRRLFYSVDQSTGYLVLPYYPYDLEQFVTLAVSTTSSSPAVKAIFNGSWIASVLVDMLRALERLHALGFVHCDVKPANIFVEIDGTPFLADFDVSLAPEELALMTTTSTSIAGPGTLNFLAPEVQKSVKNVTPKADIYSLGKTFEIILKELEKARHRAAGEVPKPVRTILRRMVDENPDARPEAWELLQELPPELLSTSETKPKNLNECHQRAGELEADLRALEQKIHELDCKSAALDADGQATLATLKQQRAVVTKALSAQRAYIQDFLSLCTFPTEWTSPYGSVGFDMRVDVTDQFLAPIQKLIDSTCRTSALGMGRDQVIRMKYERLEAKRVIRIENRVLWEKYAMTRQQMVNLRKKHPNLKCESDTEWTRSHGLTRGANELYLWHGTKPPIVQLICESGLDERVSSALSLFGMGIYLAENSSKSDQYCVPDPLTDPYNGLYPIFLCRACMGTPKSVDAKEFEFMSPQDRPRVAPYLDAANPRKGRYDGFLGHNGVGKYREFIVFDRTQVYPEYLVWYQRR